MGRNNIENRSRDINWGYNQTKGANFNYQIMNDNYTRRLELSAGMEMFKLTMSIILNADYQVDIKDKLEIKGKTFIVTYKQSVYDNDLQGKYKANLQDYTGHVVLGLE